MPRRRELSVVWSAVGIAAIVAIDPIVLGLAPRPTLWRTGCIDHQSARSHHLDSWASPAEACLEFRGPMRPT